MQTYVINEKKRKQALKLLIKDNRKTLKQFPKACYYITLAMRLTAIVGGIADVLYTVLGNKDRYDMYFLLTAFATIYLLSLIPQTVYVVSLDREFRFRRREIMTFTPDGFIYSYHDNRVSEPDSTFAYDIKYSQITRFEQNERTKILTFYGDFTTDTYSGDKITQTLNCRVFDFIDAYDIDMKQLIEQRMIEGKV